MVAETDLFEAASIVAFYHAVEKGADLTPNQDLDMYNDLKSEFPNMDSDWYLGLLKQSKALIKYLGHSEGNKDTSWKYARYGGKTKTIPEGKSTDIYDYIWNSFNRNQQQIFTGKKDSWNTTDVYMVKASDESKIKTMVDNLKDEFSDGTTAPEIYVGTVNAYLSKLLKDKSLLGISLKKPTKAEPESHVYETNLDVGPDGIDIHEGDIIGDMFTYMEITKRGGEMDFAGNSLTFEAQFKAGKYIKRYYWESKVSSVSAHATEPRDRVPNNKGKYVNATARNGAIPAPKMAELVKRYTGEDINYNIPLNGKFNEQQLKYWQSYFASLVSDRTISKDFGNISYLGQKGTPEEFIQKAFLLDDQSPNPSGKNFAVKLRSKLRILRYIKMAIEAKKQGKLAELITHAYFLSSKMNISQADLSGPFIKVQ
jgi:hypothetical protein